MTPAARIILPAALLMGLLAACPPASAACFESGVGCTDDHNMPLAVLRPLSCEALWTVRNTIFHEHGYCFHTARAQAVFSNDGCTSWETGDLGLNAHERTNVSRIQTVERQKGCR